MKITKRQLQRIIREAVLNEYGTGHEYDHLRSGNTQAGLDRLTDKARKWLDFANRNGLERSEDNEGQIILYHELHHSPVDRAIKNKARDMGARDFFTDSENDRVVIHTGEFI